MKRGVKRVLVRETDGAKPCIFPNKTCAMVCVRRCGRGGESFPFITSELKYVTWIRESVCHLCSKPLRRGIIYLSLYQSFIAFFFYIKMFLGGLALWCSS